MKIELKTLITLLAIAATVGGFYYTTQHRLNALEGEISELKDSSAQMQKQLKRLTRQNKKENK